MINPLNAIHRYMQGVEPNTRAAKAFALIPVVNNVFLEVKRFQLENENREKLNEFATTASYYFLPQIICISLLMAPLNRYISCQSAAGNIMYFAFYVLGSRHHINWIKDPS